MPRKRDGIVGIIIAINCLCAYFVTIECSENSTNIRDVQLPNNYISRYIIRLAKSAETQALFDTQVDECTNFFKFACGGRQLKNQAQNRRVAMDRFQMLEQTYERRLENFFLDFNSVTADELTRQVRDFYVSCQLVEDDLASYKLHLENVYKEYSSFPVLSDDNWQGEQDFNWWQTIADIQLKYGKQILLGVHNSSSVITIGKPHSMVRSDNSHIINSLVRFFGVEYETAERIKNEMVEFENKIMRSYLSYPQYWIPNDVFVVKQFDVFPDTLDSLNPGEEQVDEWANYGFNLREFFELVLPNADQFPIEIKLNEHYLNNLLSDILSTPKRTLSNYIIWQLLQEYIFNGKLKDLQRHCQDVTRKYYSKYVEYAIYKTYRSHEMENDVRTMFEEMRETFRDAMQNGQLDWISNSTRSYALEKLNALRLQTLPYEYIDFNKIYANLSVNRMDYVQNLRYFLILENKERLEKFNQPAEDSTTSPFSTVYNAADNSIFIPVALFPQRFLWDENYPQAIKYATLGYLIAHEMIRGFDDEGRHYDMHGNKSGWWDEKSTHEFEVRRKCFSAQYKREYAPHLPEIIDQTDNIADNAAVRLAYRAYMRWLDKQLPLEANIEQQETLPGLTFNNRQLFFVSFAQLWCVDEQKLLKLNFPTAPNEYRVNGPLANYHEFSWAFKCPLDARMDPSCKCNLY